MKISASFAICYLLLTICLSSCADIFQDKIPYSGKNESLDSLFRKADDITKLQRPRQIYVTPYYSSTDILLSWTEVKDAEYYMVERAAVSEQDWQRPGYTKPDESEYEDFKRLVYGTSFTDPVLGNPSLDAPEYMYKYFYRVSAFNTTKKYDESDPVYSEGVMLFNAPSGLKASGGTSTTYVKLEWDKTPGAKSYEIFRSDIEDDKYPEPLKVVLANQNWYQDNAVPEQGKDYYYTVVARSTFDKESLRTNPAYGYTRAPGAPSQPTVELAAGSGKGNSTSEIKIKWETSFEPDVYYAVYRYSSVDSSLTKVSGNSQITNNNYIDKLGLKPGIYYYYKVQAIKVEDGKEFKSPFSSSDDLTRSYILSPPDNVIAEKNNNGTVTVKWKPAIGSEENSYTYNVYADKMDNGNFTSLISTAGSAADSEGYICAYIPSGTGPFFRVTTVNSDESDPSIVVSPAPDAAVIQGATQREYFTDTTANSNGVYPVKITWKKPASSDEPAFYHVYRSTKSGSGFSKITDTPLNANGSGSAVYSYNSATGVYTYIDKNDTAKPGRKFYYRVLSLNKLEQGSFYSSEAIGYGALTHETYILEYNKTMGGGALKKLTLMYKPGSTDKMGTETGYGKISGTIYYNVGMSAYVTIKLDNYAEFYIENEPDKPGNEYFILNGNSDTSISNILNQSGSMKGTVTCTGMYPGKIYYDKIEIKGGGAAGGTYGVEPDGGGRKEIGYTIIN